MFGLNREIKSMLWHDAGSQRTSYRSMKEAVEAAHDGDQIILEPGIHNGMG